MDRREKVYTQDGHLQKETYLSLHQILSCGLETMQEVTTRYGERIFGVHGPPSIPIQSGTEEFTPNQKHVATPPDQA